MCMNDTAPSCNFLALTTDQGKADDLMVWSVIFSTVEQEEFGHLAHQALLLRQPGGVPGVRGSLLGALGPAEGDHVRRFSAEGARRLLAAIARGDHLWHGSYPYIRWVGSGAGLQAGTGGMPLTAATLRMPVRRAYDVGGQKHCGRAEGSILEGAGWRLLLMPRYGPVPPPSHCFSQM